MGTSAIPSSVDVAPLDAFGAADGAAVGGKAANLGELLRAGLPVPAGFVVTTGAYAAMAGRAGLTALLSPPAGPPAPSALRAAILEAEMPADLREAIAAAYRRLGESGDENESVPVAVRSSATAEDLPGAAFAGQQDTYLNVVGAEAVVDAVRRCWASLWTDRAVAYRRDRSIDPEGVRIAVIVQRMVEADVAGVMFTADPVSGARDRIVVDAGAGLGEAVVSGLVTPDHYLLDLGGEILQWTSGRGEVVIRAASGGGVRREERLGTTPGHAPLLGRERLSELAAHARTIARHFGRPQDIEWVVSGTRTWIVQSRPMTALPPPPVRLDRLQRLQASILTEYLPVRPYPMDVTTSVGRGPARMMRDVALHYGIEGVFGDFLREEDGVVVQLVPRTPRPTSRALRAIGEVVRKARRFRPAEWSRDARQAAFLAEIEALESLDLGALPWAGLLEVPERALAAQDYCRDLRIDYLPGCAMSILRIVIVLRLLGRQALLGDLLGGIPTRTEDSNRALAALARQAAADPALRALIVDASAAEALAALSGDSFAGFRARLEAFLREFGRRETASPLLVSAPTLAESPEVVLGMLRPLVAHPGPGARPVSRSAEALRKLLEHPCLRHRPRWQGRVREWVRAAQEAVAFREDTHFYFAAVLPPLRRSILEIGGRLRAAGLLDEGADVFHLRWEEVRDIEDPRALPPNRKAALRARVRQRAAKRAELSGVPMIDPARVFPRPPAGDAIATGAPAGAGTATGVARIIRGAEDFDRLGNGEILVCPYTNPAWTPLFQRAAAVVVDTGAAASHAAIVAREYGIPAVMGTGTGTSAIADGEAITVDGTRGRVTRASAGPDRVGAR